MSIRDRVYLIYGAGTRGNIARAGAKIQGACSCVVRLLSLGSRTYIAMAPSTTLQAFSKILDMLYLDQHWHDMRVPALWLLGQFVRESLLYAREAICRS